MTNEAMMWVILGGVALLVGSPIIWMFARKKLVEMGWIARFSKLDKLALDNDLRGFCERELASRAAAGIFFLGVFSSILFISALYDAIDLGQPAVLLSGVVGVFHLGSTIRQLFIGWERVSQTKFVKQVARSMEMRHESLSYRFGEEIVK